jgi:coenzyme F420 hydrogenase subunit beta
MVNSLKKETTIQRIVEQGLCIGCGTCTALCPKEALTIVESRDTGTYVPKLDHLKCNKCGLCLKICPGNEPNFDELNVIAFNRKVRNHVAGSYLKCYSGYATDQNLRYKSTSGGLVSAMAIFALEDGIADGVLTNRATSEKPLRPKSFIARTKEEIVSALGSKYCPVSANSAIDEILRKQGRYIAIGLPCHIQGQRKAQAINQELKKRIHLVFGLVCNHTPTFHATNFLLKKFKIPIANVAKIDYRSRGWPSGMRILMDDYSEHFIPFSSSYYWGYVFQKFFWPKRCIVCNDKLCQLADIIFMDAWLPKFSSDKKGSSLIVIRSKKGEEFVQKAINEGVVKLEPIPIGDVLRSQHISMAIRSVAARRVAMKYRSGESYIHNLLPQIPELTPSFLDLLDAYHLIFINKLCSNNSKLLQLIIEFHVRLWDFARSVKEKMIKM